MSRKRLLAAVTSFGMAFSITACTSPSASNVTVESGSQNEQESTSEAEESEEVWEKLTINELPDVIQTEPADSDLYVARVEDLSEDFIRGVDISSYMSEKESGVKYYDFDGNELGDEEYFEFLARCGVNWVRLRVWNDPTDKNGNSYGGGHNDVDTAIYIGRLASAAGLTVLIDFHYSDFWADPNKQKAPKEWAHLTIGDKETAIAEFTENSLNRLLNAEVNVGMVQIGNETNSGMAGETNKERVYTLMRSASSAVRSVSSERNKEILIAMHYTNPDSKGFPDICGELIDNNVDFDVLAASYYMYWHGTTENLTENLSMIVETYGKKVLVAETSYVYTDDDGDGFANVISSESTGVVLPYETSVQGQANAVRAVIEAAAAVGEASLGVFYWEPAWIPVGTPDSYDSNYRLWEDNGSGWASSYSASYDPNDAGKYYGGSSWDNQAMFDFSGKPLESLNIFKYVYSGTTAELKVVGVNSMSFESPVDEPVVMPETADAVLISGELTPIPVIWNEEQVLEAENTGAGEYVIEGVAADPDTGNEYPIICNLAIKKINYVKNPGFEESDMTMWTLTGDGVDRTEDNNKHTGTYSLKFYSEEKVEWTAEQTITGLSAGTYELSAFLQGGAAGSNPVFQLYITVDGLEYTADSGVTSWQNWDNPVISGIEIPEGASVVVGVRVSAAPKAWGAWDDFSLTKE